MDPSNPSHCCFPGHGTASFNERKSSFMKWFGKIFRGTDHSVSNGHCPCLMKENSCHRPTRAMDDQSKAENEDLDHAMALSLAEDAKNQNGYKGHDHNDEDLAKAIQESLRICPKCPNNSTQFSPRGYKVCGGCKQEISNGHYLSCIGRFWHPQCFCCYVCHQPIRDREFSLSGNQPYHKSCYKELHHPKCEVCYQFIPTNKAGLIEYRVHPFWGQRYCPSHEHDKTPRCCSCERMESRGAKYVSLGDGRSLCLECFDSAIMDTGECQPLYHSIRDYYEGMGMRIDQQIPMLLVEKQALNEAIDGEKNGRRHMPETRGLCLSEDQTVSSILEKPKIDANRTLGMRSYPQKLSPRCEVTAILALHGLPRLLTGSILAHELMHGWFRLKGYRKLRPEVEEGICQVLSHMWLESEIMPVSTRMLSSSPLPFPSSTRASISEVEKKLGEFFMNQIVHDMSPVYGGGFKAANAAVNKYGLQQTLDHVRLTGDLPV